MLDQPVPNKERSDDRYELINKFQAVLRPLGYAGIIVLVDRVDEPHLINGSAERMRDLSARELQQLRRAGRRAEGAECAGAVKAALVMIRIDRLGHLALDFESGQERLDEHAAGYVEPFAERERRRQDRHRRVCQQPEHAIGRRGELGVVVVHRVTAGAVRQRRARGRRPHPLRTEHRGAGVGAIRSRLLVEALHVLADNPAAAHRCARQHDAQTVDEAPPDLDDRLFRNGRERGLVDEGNDRVGDTRRKRALRRRRLILGIRPAACRNRSRSNRRPRR